jgi:hypothetical protein
MSGYAKILELDAERLQQKLYFLVERATAREALGDDGQQNQLRQAADATLWRDAACVAMLLDDITAAKKYLKASAQRFLKLGLFYGFLLLRLSGEEKSEVDAKSSGYSFAWVRDVLRLSESEKSDGTRDLPPYAQASAQSPYQLLRLVQSGINFSTLDGDVVEIARNRLDVYAGLTIGGTGIALGRYMKVQDAFLYGDLDDRTKSALSYMAIRRSEMIETAKADEFHWSRALNPYELIDLDMLALGLCLKNRAIEDSATSVLRERGEIAAMPFEIAAKLSGPEQGLNPRRR